MITQIVISAIGAFLVALFAWLFAVYEKRQPAKMEGQELSKINQMLDTLELIKKVQDHNLSGNMVDRLQIVEKAICAKFDTIIDSFVPSSAHPAAKVHQSGKWRLYTLTYRFRSLIDSFIRGLFYLAFTISLGVIIAVLMDPIHSGGKHGPAVGVLIVIAFSFPSLITYGIAVTMESWRRTRDEAYNKSNAADAKSRG